MLKKPIAIGIIFGSIVVLLTCILFVIHLQKTSTLIHSDNRIQNLLDQANSVLKYNPDKAYSIANDARNLAEKSQNKIGLIHALQLIAQIDDLKGMTIQASEILEKARILSIKEHIYLEQAFIHLALGKIFYKWGQYDSSLWYFRKVLDYADNYHENKLSSASLTYIGKYYQVKGNLEKSILYFQRALKIVKEMKDYSQIAFILNTEGKYYIAEGNLISALQSYQEAFEASEKAGDPLITAEVCNHLGGIYLLTGQYAKSLEYHKKALNYRVDLNNQEGLAKSYNNIGKAYMELDKLDSAANYFQQSYLLCKQTGYKKGLVKALTNMGRINLMQHDTVLSKNRMIQAFDISKKAGYNQGIAESCQALGDMYLAQSRIIKAMGYYTMSLNCLKEMDYDELLIADYKGLFECLEKQGAYKEALYYHILLLETEKRLLNVDNRRQLEIIQLSYNSEKKEKDNQVLRKDIELKEMTIKRKSTFILFIVTLLFSCLFIILYIYNRFYIITKTNKQLLILNRKVTRQNEKLEKLNEELSRTNIEKDKLFSIIAHELRNPLYWFQNLAEVLSRKYHTMTPEKIQKTLSALDESAKNAFHLMDNLLHWSRSKLNRITPKMQTVQLQSSIFETVRMYETILQHKEIKLETSILESLWVNVDPDLFNCVMRNILSNAIKYTPSNGKIRIEACKNKDNVTIKVSDSGTGMSENFVKQLNNNHNHIVIPGLMQEKGSGLGLKICKEFVELNGGTMWLTSEPCKGSTFYFTVLSPEN